MSLAAILAVALGFGLFVLAQDMLAGGAKMARIESVEGSLYRVAGDTSRPVGAGDSVAQGEEIRTAKGSTRPGADGRRLADRDEPSGPVSRSTRATRGTPSSSSAAGSSSRAAKQRSRHLYVATRDALVSVTGTIFAVNSGTKGSRVSVLQGEVRVQQGAKDALLHPGDQVTTHASVERVRAQGRGRLEPQRQGVRPAAGRADRARQGHRRPRRPSGPALLDQASRPGSGPARRCGSRWPNLTKSLSQTQQILRPADQREPVARAVVDRDPALDGQRAEVPRHDRQARRPGGQTWETRWRWR